jgi:deoxyribodipyrimidine photolyase-related protein
VKTVLVLGDQLNRSIGSLANAKPTDTRVLFVVSTTLMTRRDWHRQRLHLVLSSMKRFSLHLSSEGFSVDWRIADTMAAGIAAHRVEFAPESIVAMAPMNRAGLQVLVAANVDLIDNDQFLCSATEFADWAATRKSMKMEDFYRWQRVRLDILMDGNEPSGGTWNFDHDNREPPPKDGRSWPKPELAHLDSIDEEISALIDSYAPQTTGSPWNGLWPTTTAQALARLDRVVKEVLPKFGPHEDAMLTSSWHLAHTVLSSSMNIGLLHPSQVVEAAHNAFRKGDVPIASAEGFIRQIIGWREYVSGLYWLWGPNYRELNHLDAHEPLPPAFRDAGATKMRCVQTAVQGIEDRAYAHHIQRLMVLGNLALIAGINPQAMTDWMQERFIDGADWVMAPNVIGMSLHADGGMMATKPYAAGGAYISKMSDSCKGCAYDPKKRSGPTACPFTTLYWDFLDRHDERFRKNHRMAQVMAGARKLSDMPDVRIRATEVRQLLARGEL